MAKLSDAQIAFMAKMEKWGGIMIRTDNKKDIRTGNSLAKKGLIVKENISVRYVQYNAIPADVPTESTLADELPAYRDEAFEEEQRNMTQSDYDDKGENRPFEEQAIPVMYTYIEPTFPTLTFSERAALIRGTAFCHTTMTPQATCECAWCSKTRLEGEVATLKARVEDLRNLIGQIAKCRTLSAIDSLIERFDYDHAGNE